MGFEFAETMSGTVEWDAEPGKQHPFRFEITRARGVDPRALRRRHARTSAASITRRRSRRRADAEGMITIRPLGQRIIRYELSFLGDDGKRYEMVGQKDIRWRRRSRRSRPARRDPRRGPPAGRHLSDQVRLPERLVVLPRSFRPA